MKFVDIMTEAHATAIEKGWHDEHERSHARALSLVALVHAEIVETSDAIPLPRANKSELFCVHGGKPYGVLVEIADIIIRLADMHAFFGWPDNDAALRPAGPSGPAFLWSLADTPIAIVGLHSLMASGYTEAIRSAGRPSAGAAEAMITMCEKLADSLAMHLGAEPLGLTAAVRAKMEFNKTRPFRHGGKFV